jgi:hypothetical protein
MYVNKRHIDQNLVHIGDVAKLSKIRLTRPTKSEAWLLEGEGNLIWTVWDEDPAFSLIPKLISAIKQSEKEWLVTIVPKKPYFSITPSSDGCQWVFTTSTNTLEKAEFVPETELEEDSLFSRLNSLLEGIEAGNILPVGGTSEKPVYQLPDSPSPSDKKRNSSRKE